MFSKISSLYYRYNSSFFKPVNRLSFHSSTFLRNNSDLCTINWVLKDGSTKIIQAKIGTNILDLAHEHKIDLEGACEKSLACSTCHVIVDPDYYKKLTEPCDEENDMLDLAFGLTDSSRLGCQLFVTKELDGVTLRLPRATRNMAVDGYIPKPH